MMRTNLSQLAQRSNHRGGHGRVGARMVKIGKWSQSWRSSKANEGRVSCRHIDAIRGSMMEI